MLGWGRWWILTPTPGPSQVAEQFVFLAPVHLGCPLAGALLVCPLLGHCQWDVEVQEGAGCRMALVTLLRIGLEGQEGASALQCPPGQPHSGRSVQTPLSGHRLPPASPALPLWGSHWSQGTWPAAQGWTGSRTQSWTAALHHLPREEQGASVSGAAPALGFGNSPWSCKTHLGGHEIHPPTT